MNIGAGTVISAKQCEEALAAGAKFIVSPGLSVAVANICKENNIPYYPGCVTPTEIMQALELGITTVKFFNPLTHLLSLLIYQNLLLQQIMLLRLMLLGLVL